MSKKFLTLIFLWIYTYIRAYVHFECLFSFVGFIAFLANTSSIIIAVITLVLHHYIEKEPIKLSTLFTSFALFNQLTVPLFIFPIMVPIVISAAVSSFLHY